MSEACNEDMTISVSIIQTTTVHFNNAVLVHWHVWWYRYLHHATLLDSLESVVWVVNVDDDNDNDDDDDVSRRNQSKSRHKPPPLDMPIYGRRIRARVRQTGHKNGKLSPPPTARHHTSRLTLLRWTVAHIKVRRSFYLLLKPSDWGATHRPLARHRHQPPVNQCFI